MACCLRQNEDMVQRQLWERIIIMQHVTMHDYKLQYSLVVTASSAVVLSEGLLVRWCIGVSTYNQLWRCS